MERYFKIMYPELRKMSKASDYCDLCHELERDLLVAKSEFEYAQIKNNLKLHLKLAKVEREEYLYLI